MYLLNPLFDLFARRVYLLSFLRSTMRNARTTACADVGAFSSIGHQEIRGSR